MVYGMVLTVVILTSLIIATFTDLKAREVPDWLSYGLIIAGLSLNLLFSVIYQDYWFIINSIAGFVLFLIIALVMFYAGQWGGGDSKVLMGLGALLGLDVRFTDFPFILSFLINILLIGAIYGLIWSFSLAFKNWKNFSKEFKKICSDGKTKKSRTYVFIFVLLIVILTFISRDKIITSFFFALSLISLITFYLWIFVKSIEKTCMIKAVAPTRLTEGDWIVKNIKYKGKHICGPKDLGIEKKQIKQLVKLYKEKKIGKVLIKEGLPFVPSFLIAYVITLVLGNLLFLLV